MQLGTEAQATTSILMTIDELATKSSLAVVAQPVERFSQWEELGGSKRIVTYTRLVIEEEMFGSAQTDQIWVRTLGGKVDGIGQYVAGEAELRIGQTTVVFLAAIGSTLVVTGMAQGHYPLLVSEHDRLLTSSPDMGTLLPRKKGEKDPRSARDLLIGASLSEARKIIVAAKKAAKQ